MESTFVDTHAALEHLMNDLGDCDGQPPRLYMDLEGNNLSRHGTLSLITILLQPQGKIYLVDVTTLGKHAFTIAGSDGRTLQTVMESKNVIKVFFDIRNDSDALFGLYGLRVAGIEDLQLMELASRNFSKQNVNGLAKCIERDSTIDYRERQKWQTVKEKGKKLFDPCRGGTYAVFDQRPLTEAIKSYCIQDVTFMPHLRETYRKKLCDAWWKMIESETSARIVSSQSPSYNGKGQHQARGPSMWLSWSPSMAERGVRTLLDTSISRTQASVTPAQLHSHNQAGSAPKEDNGVADMVVTLALTRLQESNSLQQRL